ACELRADPRLAAAREARDVVAVAADELVAAAHVVDDELIVAVAAVERVGTVVVERGVGARAVGPAERVLALAEQRVVAAAAFEVIVAGRAGEEHIGFAAADQVIAALAAAGVDLELAREVAGERDRIGAGVAPHRDVVERIAAMRRRAVIPADVAAHGVRALVGAADAGGKRRTPCAATSAGMTARRRIAAIR